MRGRTDDEDPAPLRARRTPADADLHALLRPLPSSLAAATPEAAEHERLADRYGEANAAVIALERKLADAERGDEMAARRAVETGHEIPKAKAPAIRDKLAEAERVRSVIAEVVPESAVRLLAAATPHAGPVSEQADERATELELEALDLLATARDALASAAEVRGQGAWAARLAEEGSVRPWAHSTAPSLDVIVRETIQRIEHERERRVERVAEREHELIAANAVPTPGGGFRVLEPPPGQELVIGRDAR